MAYTTISDIQAYFPSITFSTGTNPSSTQITGWISEAETIIDGALYERYSVPITDSSDKLRIKHLADMYVVANIEFVIGSNNYNVVNQKNKKPRSMMHDEFYAMLKEFQDGKIILINTSNNNIYSYASSYNTDNDIEAVAEKEEDQW